ncbi:MAG: hypothetical protein IIA35_05820, partial [Proteobacteria bacterium]|nr:hypothetical protein [Pseudomonadota bacterium]
MRAPVDLDDLVQIGWVELWKAVEDYRWRCQLCPKAARSIEGFQAHGGRAHPRRPRSSIRADTRRQSCRPGNPRAGRTRAPAGDRASTCGASSAWPR